jgi:hypothetical protein
LVTLPAGVYQNVTHYFPFSFVEREDPAIADEPNSPENSPGIEIKQPDESSTNSMSKVWTGRINFTEGQKVHANGYIIGGKIDKKLIRRGLPKELRVAGSLTFNDAGKVGCFFYTKV